MTNEEAYNIISEFCFTGYEDNKKPSFKLFGAIHELILDVEENTKLKAEIKRLNGKSEMYRDMADSFCNSNIKLEAENEQLKELIPKICETCRYEDELGYEEPCNNCKNSSNWILKGATND